MSGNLSKLCRHVLEEYTYGTYTVLCTVLFILVLQSMQQVAYKCCFLKHIPIICSALWSPHGALSGSAVTLGSASTGASGVRGRAEHVPT